MGEKYTYKEIALKFKEICILISDGVVYKDKIRKFDLIDLYLTLNMSVNEINNYLTRCKRYKYITCKEFDMISTLIKHYDYNKTPGVTYNILKSVRYIYGDREITLEEKQMIYNFLQNNNIPFTDAIFNTAVRDFALYGLDISNNNVKKKVRKIDN